MASQGRRVRVNIEDPVYQILDTAEKEMLISGLQLLMPYDDVDGWGSVVIAEAV
jgi:hypothetical protein